MIAVDSATRSVLTRSYRAFVRAESWLGDTLLADGIPVAGGVEEGNAGAQVPERITLTVPRRSRGVDWSPVTDTAPLAANGQRLRVEVGVGITRDVVTWIQRGWFVITKCEPTAAGALAVEAANLLWLIQEARLVSPFQPSGTMLSTLRTLLEPTLTTRDIGGVIDRAVPASVTFDEDRLGGVYELLDAWAVRGRVDENGSFIVTPNDTPTAGLLDFTDGVGGTAVRIAGSSERQGGHTLVVARGQDSAGNAVQGVAYVDTGPRKYGGPFNPQPVPVFFFSPLLSTVDQARQAAQTVLARKRRASGREVTVEAVPDPTIQLGDAVTATPADGVPLLCTVESYTLPYRPAGGTMRLTLRAVA